MTRAINPVSTDRELTFEEYLATPETNLRQEVIDGVIVMSPAPTFRHQLIFLNLTIALNDHVRSHALGTVVPAPADLLIRTRPKLRVRQPDLLFVENARSTRKELMQVQILQVTPNLAVEIRSPSDSPARWVEKLADYASIGVPEVWLVDPDTEAVEVHSLAEGRYSMAGRFADDDEVRSGVLPGLALPARQIFG
jgi:Uma2 family endonuclease